MVGLPLLEGEDKYPLLKHEIPCFAAKDVTDGELDKVQRQVEHNAVEPNHTSPPPANALHIAEGPLGIHGYHCGNLHFEPIGHEHIQMLRKPIHASTIDAGLAAGCLHTLTNCAAKNANIRSVPGRSTKDQL